MSCVTRLLLLRGTTAQRTAMTPLAGELIYDTDLGQVFVGDGSTAGGNPLEGLEGVEVEYFERVSKNLKSWDASFSYTGTQLDSITYTDGVSTIVKTFNYTGSQLTSIVLSGDTPSGIDLTKTFSYTGSQLTGVAYS